MLSSTLDFFFPLHILLPPPPGLTALIQQLCHLLSKELNLSLLTRTGVLKCNRSSLVSVIVTTKADDNFTQK